jgi:AcrR family transcriptional regulator
VSRLFLPFGMEAMLKYFYMKAAARNAKPKAPLGRPRAFDPEAALERALQVFWRKGYEGASLSDLTKAMRINRPSLYAAFGNKEALFFKALDRYVNGRAAHVREALNEPTARAVVERLLRGTADMPSNKKNPAGCLLVQGALACGESSERIKKELISRRKAVEALIRQRLERAQSENDLPAGSDPAILARYIVAVINGMAVQAASGASREDLQGVAETALQSWPA